MLGQDTLFTLDPKLSEGVSGHQSSLQASAIKLRPPTLQFDSLFESGNLQKAVQASLQLGIVAQELIYTCKHLYIEMMP